MEQIGPVDFVIVGFPGNEFRGDIAPALADLSEAGTIRIIDIAFVGKNEAGDTLTFELMELDPEVQAGLDSMGIEVQGLFNEEDLQIVADGLEPDTSAALIVWENVWARGIAQSLRDAGGVLIDSGRIPHDVVQAAREYAVSNA
jgi:hypothetical protein